MLKYSLVENILALNPNSYVAELKYWIQVEWFMETLVINPILNADDTDNTDLYRVEIPIISVIRVLLRQSCPDNIRGSRVKRGMTGYMCQARDNRNPP